MDEKAEIAAALYAIKGMASEATPEQQQALAAARQIFADTLDTYGDIGKVALQIAALELQLKEY
jgi:hypothetical protein